MSNYIKASDLKINDFIYESYRGDVGNILKITKIEYIQTLNIKWLIFNKYIVFKYDGSKGFRFKQAELQEEYNFAKFFEVYEKSNQIFTSDKRVATTHAVNFLKKEINLHEKEINEITKSMINICNKIATLRLEEHD
jgi:hypothetical protein